MKEVSVSRVRKKRGPHITQRSSIITNEVNKVVFYIYNYFELFLENFVFSKEDLGIFKTNVVSVDNEWSRTADLNT